MNDNTPQTPRYWLDKIHQLANAGADPIRIMNVCGGHERTITHAGLRKALPESIEIIPGPGCPVCVCPEEDIHAAIQLALKDDVILASFGDMLRVPHNAPHSKSENMPRSLQEAKTQGAHVVPIASPQEVLGLAKAHPHKTVIFFAAGFETTTAPIAALFSKQTLNALPDNLLLLLSARLTWPAVSFLLAPGDAAFNALIAPGHVATIMGAEQWRFVAEDYALPTAIAGFTPTLLLQAIYSVLLQKRQGVARLENCYPQSVKPGGNTHAQVLLNEAFDIVDAPWRGIGVLPQSGFACKAHLAERDARNHFPEVFETSHRRRGEMPAGCDCAKVILGKITPLECRLYGKACRPAQPIGPCMVSDEGACRIWWDGGLQPQQQQQQQISG